MEGDSSPSCIASADNSVGSSDANLYLDTMKFVANSQALAESSNNIVNKVSRRRGCPHKVSSKGLTKPTQFASCPEFILRAGFKRPRSTQDYSTPAANIPPPGKMLRSTADAVAMGKQDQGSGDVSEANSVNNNAPAKCNSIDELFSKTLGKRIVPILLLWNRD